MTSGMKFDFAWVRNNEMCGWKIMESQYLES